MAVIDNARTLARLSYMLLDPEVGVGMLLPLDYCGLLMSINWRSFEREYGINLVYLYKRSVSFSQEMLDAFHVELGWAEGKPPVEEDIWL